MVIEDKAIRSLQMVSQASRLKAPIMRRYREQYSEFSETINLEHGWHCSKFIKDGFKNKNKIYIRLFQIIA